MLHSIWLCGSDLLIFMPDSCPVIDIDLRNLGGWELDSFIWPHICCTRSIWLCGSFSCPVIDIDLRNFCLQLRQITGESYFRWAGTWLHAGRNTVIVLRV